MVPQNIKINNVKSLDAKLIHDEYFDFMLYKGEAYGVSDENECLAAFIDFNDEACYTDDGGVQSNMSWAGSVNSGVEMNEIGWVAVDNGLITYDRDAIRNEDFVKLFFDSVLTIDKDDTRFHMHAVDGNTKEFVYPISIESESGKTYISCKGGFLQGFFKAYGYDYQVLPDVIDNEWQFDIELRPRSDYETKDNILNNTYPDNAGTFFYIGTRAENKFAELYNKTSAYTEQYDTEYLSPQIKSLKYYEYDDPGYPYGGDIDFFRTVEREKGYAYLHSDYTDEDYYHYDDPDPMDDYDIDYFRREIVEEKDKMPYLNNDEDMSMSGVGIDICEDKNGGTSKTNNKFLLFNCHTGFTTHTWDRRLDNASFIVRYEHRKYKTNPFLLFNHTCSGYTTHTIDQYFEDSVDETDDYNIMKDVIGNAFSLKYNSDGSITYNYTMHDCSSEEKYTQQSETTKPGILKDGEWNSVSIKFTMLDSTYSDCVTTDDSGNTVHTMVLSNAGKRKMRMRIYVNGYLVFISKELEEFRFRELDDDANKQEGVPYNISLGGGTQGLGERIWLDYFRPVTSHYFLEKNYAGSFIGDIRSFKMYDCGKNYQTIKYNYIKNKLI